MRPLFVVLVAVTATLAFTSVAYSQGEGAQTIPCSAIYGEGAGVTGPFVFTPAGNNMANCDWPGPASGEPAQVYRCDEFFPFGDPQSGNVVITPNGHLKFFCTPI